MDRDEIKMRTITLTNDFHGTRATVRPRVDGTMAPATVRRVRRELCGMSDCRCSGYLGTRGPQIASVEPVYDDAGTYRVAL